MAAHATDGIGALVWEFIKFFTLISIILGLVAVGIVFLVEKIYAKLELEKVTVKDHKTKSLRSYFVIFVTVTITSEFIFWLYMVFSFR